MELARIKPDYRNNGKYQFIVGYGGGMQTVRCVHLAFHEVDRRLREKYGDGRLEDDGTHLIYSRKEQSCRNA